MGKENVSSAEAICKQHGRDEGIERGLPPNLVVWPRTTEEVSAIARICYKNKFPMIPFGTGTGLESGVCAVQESQTFHSSKIVKIFCVGKTCNTKQNYNLGRCLCRYVQNGPDFKFQHGRL